jgi:hypothetical protein
MSLRNAARCCGENTRAKNRRGCRRLNPKRKSACTRSNVSDLITHWQWSCATAQQAQSGSHRLATGAGYSLRRVLRSVRTTEQITLHAPDSMQRGVSIAASAGLVVGSTDHQAVDAGTGHKRIPDRGTPEARGLAFFSALGGRFGSMVGGGEGTVGAAYVAA